VSFSLPIHLLLSSPRCSSISFEFNSKKN